MPPRVLPRVQPEFLSGEASASPSVEPLLAGAHRLSELGFGAGFLSARNGLRTTTHAMLPLGVLSAQDFVEVADYDPHLDRLLCIGSRAPHPHAGLHALIMRAKREVGALVMLDCAERPDVLAPLPQAKRGPRQIDSAMAALEALRGRDAVALGTFLLVTAPTPEQATALAERMVAR